MAIHVRQTNIVKRKMTSILRRIVALASVSALFVLLCTALILKLKEFHYLRIDKIAFLGTIKTTPEVKEEKPEKKKQEEKPTESSPSSAPAATPDIDYINPPPPTTSPLIAKDSPVEIDVDHSSSDSDEGDTLADIGSGIDGLGDFGDGSGDGFGDGVGTGDSTGDGDGKPESGGKNKGFNDDIQVVLLLDASGSMNELFTAAANSMERVLHSLKNAKLNGKKTKVNVGVVIYGQAHKDGAPIKLSGFTTNVRNLKKRLSEVSCDGSNEECGAAIAFATQPRHFEWNNRERDDMLKVIFIAGNEEFNQGPIDYKKAIETATSQHIIINTIHCGESDETWENAAELGNGTGLTLNIDASTATPVTPQELYETLKALHDIKPLPVGSLNTQQKHLKELKHLTPPPRDTKTKDYASRLQRWIIANKQRVITGYEWDAIEICRKSPEFSLECIGGIGNAPLELRGLSEEEIEQHIITQAKQRSKLLQRYYEQRKSGDLADKILTVLQEQAERKGIIIDY